MQDFRNLKVWQKAHPLVLEIYKTTKSFPKEETYGLVSQMRRSASSIPTNIAEGSGRRSDVDFARFVIIAISSAKELEYQLLLAKDLAYLDSESYERLVNIVCEVNRMLMGLLKSLDCKYLLQPGASR